MKNFLFNHLSLPHFYLFLPSTLAVEFLIIFAEVETSIVQTFVEIFRCYFFTTFLEFDSAS